MKLSKFIGFATLLLFTSLSFASGDPSTVPPPLCGPHAKGAHTTKIHQEKTVKKTKVVTHTQTSS